ncbi:GNAT family N-acetyltransferase [Jatrophihabitans sp. YIM 134969]
MPAPEQLTTDRLLLRRWRPSDLEPLAALNADPEVMRWFPSPLDREQSDAWVAARVPATFEEGAGLWALERRDTGAFIGFAGCAWQRFDAPFTPALEVGWRLAREHWGVGFAPEAAAAALDDVVARGVADEVVSLTAVGNVNSRRVMTKLGMTHDPADDFDHPNVPADSPLRRHVLYRLRAQDWRGSSWSVQELPSGSENQA